MTTEKRSVKDILKLNRGGPAQVFTKTEYTVNDRMSQVEFDRIRDGLTTRHKPDIILMLQDLFVRGISVAECSLKYERSKSVIAIHKSNFINDANQQNKNK